MTSPLLWIVTRFYGTAITFLYKTARLRVLGEEALRDLWREGGKAIVCFFHGNYLLLFPHFRGSDACIFTTRSKRGRYIAEIIRLFGYRPCMIPDQRGRHLALEQMARELAEGHNAAVAVDGPLGPRHQVKHGVVVLAARTGYPIVPVGLASSPSLTLRKRWDHYSIPLPWARSVICVGAPIPVPSRAELEESEALRRRVQEELLRLNRRAREYLGEGQGG